MASRNQNITIDIGTDFFVDVVAYANGSAATPLDLSALSYSANADIKKSYLYTNSAATFNVWVKDETTGKINLHLNVANTVKMEAGRYVYDVMLLNDSTSVKTRVIEGIATVTPGVAK